MTRETIKFGDIEYFTLLEFQRKLMYVGYDKLDLACLDKLRNEIAIKIERINLDDKERREKEKQSL